MLHFLLAIICVPLALLAITITIRLFPYFIGGSVVTVVWFGALGIAVVNGADEWIRIALLIAMVTTFVVGVIAEIYHWVEGF